MRAKTSAWVYPIVILSSAFLASLFEPEKIDETKIIRGIQGNVRSIADMLAGDYTGITFAILDSALFAEEGTGMYASSSTVRAAGDGRDAIPVTASPPDDAYTLALLDRNPSRHASGSFGNEDTLIIRYAQRQGDGIVEYDTRYALATGQPIRVERAFYTADGQALPGVHPGFSADQRLNVAGGLVEQVARELQRQVRAKK